MASSGPVRDAIVAGAIAVFAKRGIAATRVEDILVAAKVSRRTFYKYFTSKEDVLSALFDQWTGEFIRVIEQIIAARTERPLAGIRAGIDLFLGFYRSGSRAVREVAEIAVRGDSMLAPRRAWFRAELVRIIDDEVFAFDGRRLDPFVYYTLLAGLEGLSIDLGAEQRSAAEVERARVAFHAIVDRSLGLPDAAPLPKAKRR